MTLQIRHDESAQQFTAELEGQRAQLDYELSGKTMSITHTLVPPAFRGRGIAAELMQAAVAFAAQRTLSIEPLCSYAVAFLRRQTLVSAGQGHQEDLLDEALDESFPASDPPAVGRVD